MKTIARGSLLLLLAVGASEMAGCSASAPNEALGKTSQAVGNGTDSVRRYAPWLRYTNLEGDVTWCSATLLTPVWVATANHCITGASTRYAVAVFSDADLAAMNITVGFSETVDAPGPMFFHTPTEGAVRVKHKKVIDEKSHEESATDLALFKLSARVPASVAARFSAWMRS